jgi:hypothetical protein
MIETMETTTTSNPIAILDRDRCRHIAQHVATDYARDKVARALFSAVVQGLEFGPRDLPRPEDREWINANLGESLQEATDAAISALVWSVSRALERAPDGLVDRYERSHHLEELGFE